MENNIICNHKIDFILYAVVALRQSKSSVCVYSREGTKYYPPWSIAAVFGYQYFCGYSIILCTVGLHQLWCLLYFLTPHFRHFHFKYAYMKHLKDYILIGPQLTSVFHSVLRQLWLYLSLMYPA